MNTTTTEILRAYTRQFEGVEHDRATEEEILSLAMDMVINMRNMPLPLLKDYDINRARRDLVSSAQRLGLPVEEYIGAVNYMAAFTQERLDAEFEIERAIRTFRELELIGAKPLRDFYQVDGWANVEPGDPIMNPDGHGDVMFSSRKWEPQRSDTTVRIYIAAEAERDDVLRILRKQLAWIENGNALAFDDAASCEAPF